MLLQENFGEEHIRELQGISHRDPVLLERAWHVEGGAPVVNTLLKTPAAKRDVPIPKCLVACLREEREKSESEYVISNSKGTVLTETQFVRAWKYIPQNAVITPM